MEMVLKIADALKDGEITFSELSELLNDLKTFDIKKLKKLLNYLSLAALFVPQLKPYAVCIQSLKNILDGGTLKLEDIVKLIPLEYQDKLRTAIAFTPGIISTEGSYLDSIDQLMGILSCNTNSSIKIKKPLNPAKDCIHGLRDAKVKMALNTESMERIFNDPRT